MPLNTESIENGVEKRILNTDKKSVSIFFHTAYAINELNKIKEINRNDFIYKTYFSK